MEEEEADRMGMLRNRLNEIHHWPSVYMFKFILPNEAEKVTRLKLIFGESAEFKHKFSKNNKYTSITVLEMMLDADTIFERYITASSIEGIISM